MEYVFGLPGMRPKAPFFRFLGPAPYGPSPFLTNDAAQVDVRQDCSIMAHKKPSTRSLSDSIVYLVILKISILLCRT